MESRAPTKVSHEPPIITYRSDDRVAIITLLWTTSDGKSATSSYSSRRDGTYLENHSIGDFSGGGPIIIDRLEEIETELSLPLARTLNSRRPEVEALFRNLGIQAVHLPVRSCP